MGIDLLTPLLSPESPLSSGLESPSGAHRSPIEVRYDGQGYTFIGHGLTPLARGYVSLWTGKIHKVELDKFDLRIITRSPFP